MSDRDDSDLTVVAANNDDPTVVPITGPADEMEAERASQLALLTSLRSEHQRIKAEIKALETNGVLDMLKIKRMKKIKLSMKDQITYLENILTPDIIA